MWHYVIKFTKYILLKMFKYFEFLLFLQKKEIEIILKVHIF